MLSLSLFFIKLMGPQNDKIGVLEVRKIKTFFAAQPRRTDLLRICVSFSPRVLQWWYPYKIIEKR